MKCSQRLGVLLEAADHFEITCQNLQCNSYRMVQANTSQQNKHSAQNQLHFWKALVSGCTRRCPKDSHPLALDCGEGALKGTIRREDQTDVRFEILRLFTV